MKKNDCVIIPQWGALIAQYSHARFDTATGMLIAPKRTISFNESINVNDGLLADSIARKENISYSDALKKIETEVSGMKHQIFLGSEIALGRIGFFSLNNEDKLSFESFAINEAQSEFFGLRSIQFDTLESLNKQREVEDVKGEIKPTIHRRRLSYALRYAASVVLLIALSVILTTPITINDENNEFASLNIIASQKKEPVIVVKETKGDLIVAIPNEEQTVVEKEPKIEEHIKSIYKKENKQATLEQKEIVAEPVINNNEENASFYLIVASLPSQEAAENHIVKVGDSDMRILANDGKYRIYVASSSSISTLNKLKRTSAISSNYPGAWICKK